jgi:hypothetical protein
MFCYLKTGNGGTRLGAAVWQVGRYFLVPSMESTGHTSAQEWQSVQQAASMI